jgi:NIPSNAP
MMVGLVIRNNRVCGRGAPSTRRATELSWRGGSLYLGVMGNGTEGGLEEQQVLKIAQTPPPVGNFSHPRFGASEFWLENRRFRENLPGYVCAMHPMKSLFLLFIASLLAPSALVAAEPADSRCFELRVYYAAPGKLDELHARFRDHTMRIFGKHQMASLGYWTPIENPNQKLLYMLAFPSRDARDKAWKEFSADPEWKKVLADSEANGKLVTKVESTFLQATDFSPEIKPSAGPKAFNGGGTSGAATGASPDQFPFPAGRVFELRTYTTTPGNLPILLKRFRDHTMTLFTKHGMTNLFYWTLLPGQTGSDNTLVYMLAHPSQEQAAASFKEFRADPEWVAVKEASEKEGGGSLTVVPDGVVSVFLRPTDYSPTR